MGASLPFPFLEKEPKFGPIGKSTYEGHYSRPQKTGEFEHWRDTVIRVVDGNLAFVPSKYHEPNERENLIKLIYSFGLMPAGRHLWVTGIPGRQFINNCFTSGWVQEKPSEHTCFMFMRLMEGGGVGANYSDEYTKRLPFVCSVPDLHFVCSPDHKDYEKLKPFLSDPKKGGYAYEWQFSKVVSDDREGWNEALELLIESFYKHRPLPIVLDLSRVREQGAPIKSFGGTASGPYYLAQMLKEVHTILKAAYGRRVTGLEWMEIDHSVAVGVVSGGTRRSARMAMKHWKDSDIIDFITCKVDGKTHWTTNISVIVDNEFIRSYKAHDPLARQILELVSLHAVKNGEPGLWNIDLAREGEADPEMMYCTNPCGEICMPAWDVCCLGHINMAEFVHKPSKMYEAARLMTRFLIRATFGDVNDPKSRAVVDRNRRIGVGLMGYHNWLVGHRVKYSESWESGFVKKVLKEMKEVVDRECVRYSSQLRIPVPVKNTTLAPTGSTSLIPGVVGSAQCDIFNYFDRRTIRNPNDPNHARLIAEHRDSGGEVEDSYYSPGMKVVVAKCKSVLTEYCEENNCEHLLEDSTTVTPEDMLAVQAMFQEIWADNAISYTVNFPVKYVDKFVQNPITGMYDPDFTGKEKELESQAKDIESLLIQYIPRLKGTTLMPDLSNRPQPPYTPISKEEYEASLKKEMSDSFKECLNGSCPIR